MRRFIALSIFLFVLQSCEKEDYRAHFEGSYEVVVDRQWGGGGMSDTGYVSHLHDTIYSDIALIRMNPEGEKLLTLSLSNGKEFYIAVNRKGDLKAANNLNCDSYTCVSGNISNSKIHFNHSFSPHNYCNRYEIIGERE